MHGRWNSLVEALKNFSVWARHYQARRPMVYALVGGAFSAVLLTLLTWTYAPLSVSIVEGLIFATVSTGFQMIYWRPGGRGRRLYQEWCARQEGGPAPVVFPEGSPPPGWYQHPERRNRVRFWNGAQWV
jgi:hypothetical protein